MEFMFRMEFMAACIGPSTSTSSTLHSLRGTSLGLKAKELVGGHKGLFIGKRILN